MTSHGEVKTGTSPAPLATVRGEAPRCAGRCIELWKATPDGFPDLGPAVPRSVKIANERAADRFLDEIEEGFLRAPREREARRDWQDDMLRRLRRDAAHFVGAHDGQTRLLLSDPFFDLLIQFVKAGRRFDPDLVVEDVYQALRNVWIAGSMQLLVDLPVLATPSLCAYSLLYPYTDNALDDPTAGPDAKRSRSLSLEARLRGLRPAPRDPAEEKVFRLVSWIEGDHDRVRFPEVYASLLEIHRAQVASLRQQDPAIDPGADEILRLSVEKGGASVLADGYLLRGWLTPEEADFFFGYGVFLQLLDDLQDVERDREVGHRTLFSAAAGRIPLDGLVGKLHGFMVRLLEPAPRLGDPAVNADLRGMILENCTSLITFAAAHHRHLFGPRFLRELEARSAFRFGYLRRKRGSIRRRFGRLQKELRRRRGVASPFDLLA